jgi:glycosyltransferase involved in cell wall biosynthesis
MAKHKVSVIIPCHNLHNYLPDAVESVKAQTYTSIETIVVHDGCSGNIPMVAGGTTIIREENRGVAITRDEGFKMSRGNLILFLDADDTLAENFIEECVRHVDTADIIYGDVLLWSRWGEEALHKNVWHQVDPKITLKKMKAYNHVVVTALMRRAVYETVGPFDGSLPMYEDWDLWIKSLKQGCIFKKANTYMKYRQRNGSRNNQSDEIMRNTNDIIREAHFK